MTSTKEPALRVGLLGQFGVWRHGVPIPESDWPRKKTKDLLKVLLTAPGELFLVDQLVEALFPESDSNRSGSNIRSRVSELRRILEPELKHGRDSSYIARQGQAYLFDLDADCEVDTIAFETALRQAHDHADAERWMEAVECFESALALYKGGFLPEDRYDEWAQSTRERLKEEYLAGLGRLAECYDELGRTRQAIDCCHRVLAVKPHREDVIRQLMECQQEAGQSALALDTYNQAARSLMDYLCVEPSGQTRALRDQIARQTREEPSLDPRRIAVLPLRNYSPDPADEYIADGITEELIGCLAKVRDFRVVAATSVMRFKGTAKPISQIAQALNVGTILEGSVFKAGERVRISAQLIDAATEDHLWAEHYDLQLEGILEVQGKIARSAAQSLKVELLSGEEAAFRSAESGNTEAHIDYLMGRHFLETPNREALETAIHHFEEALHKDPEHARALTGLADAHCRLVEYATEGDGYAKARGYIDQAFALDGALAEAHCSLAVIARDFEKNPEEAERLLRHAIEFDPNYAQAHADYARLLGATDRTDEAIAASRRALGLDPLSASLNLTYADCLSKAARFHEAIEQAEKTIELDPESGEAWWILWYSLAATWDWDRAESVLREAVAKYPENPYSYVNLAMCVQCRGRLAEGVAEIEEALALPGAADRLTVLAYAGHIYYFARMYDVAERYYRTVLKRVPVWSEPRVMLAKCHVQRKRFDEALAELAAAEKTYGLIDSTWLCHARMERGRIHAWRGETEEAEAELESLKRLESRQNKRIAVALLLHALGRTDEALDWLEDAVNEREPHVAAFRKAPDMPPDLREHPRVQSLLKRIGLGD
ncbi:BTAD domain-containing putative transcriptional regulator [Candidatus Bipolaricaulota bacterium]